MLSLWSSSNRPNDISLRSLVLDLFTYRSLCGVGVMHVTVQFVRMLYSVMSFPIYAPLLVVYLHCLCNCVVNPTVYVDIMNLFYTSASCCIESSLFVVPTSIYNATIFLIQFAHQKVKI
jgi:hypothetical protein